METLAYGPSLESKTLPALHDLVGPTSPQSNERCRQITSKGFTPFLCKDKYHKQKGSSETSLCYWLLSIVALLSRCSSIFLVMLQPQMSSKDTVELRVFAKEPKQVKHRESNWQRLNFFETDLSLSKAPSQTALTRSVNSSFPSICVKPVS